MYTCKHLYKTILFHQTCIKSCSTNGEGITLGYNIDDLSLKNLEEKYSQTLNLFENGIIPEHCKNCFELKENTLNIKMDKKVKLEIFYISNWFHCNADCIFCIHKYNTQEKPEDIIKKSSTYDVLPILKMLKKQKLIGEYPIVYVTGGEPALLKELPEVLDFFIENNAVFFQFYTSAIKFSNEIGNILSSNIHSEAIISIDSGNSDLYKKIKRVDKFYEVVANIKSYSELCNINVKNKVIVKYILLQGINDNCKNIQEWIELMKQIGIKDVRLDIDYNWDFSAKSNVNELFMFAKNLAQKLNLNIDITEMTKQNITAAN